MHESINLLKEKLAGDDAAIELLEALDLELSASALCDSERRRLQSGLDEAAAEIEEARSEAAQAAHELEAHTADIAALKETLMQSRLSGALAVEAAKAGCVQPWDLLKLAGCDGAHFDAQGELLGVAEWLRRVRLEKAWMFESRRSAPPLYRAAAGANEDNVTNGVLAGAARHYDGQ